MAERLTLLEQENVKNIKSLQEDFAVIRKKDCVEFPFNIRHNAINPKCKDTSCFTRIEGNQDVWKEGMALVGGVKIKNGKEVDLCSNSEKLNFKTIFERMQGFYKEQFDEFEEERKRLERIANFNKEGGFSKITNELKELLK